jgi:membrane carboxypeptidase/penicillin-binding protein
VFSRSLAYSATIRRRLEPFHVVYVRVPEAKSGARAEIRVRPVVQGAAVILENKTGRVMAIAGGFSYPLSQLNRASQAQRQPGSAIKPLTSLAALQSGLQPNTLVPDSSITPPPIGGAAHAREENYWSPKLGASSGAAKSAAAVSWPASPASNLHCPTRSARCARFAANRIRGRGSHCPPPIRSTWSAS